jgi:hypothetical protein
MKFTNSELQKKLSSGLLIKEELTVYQAVFTVLGESKGIDWNTIR